jgi:membrane protein
MPPPSPSRRADIGRNLKRGRGAPLVPARNDIAFEEKVTRRPVKALLARAAEAARRYARSVWARDRADMTGWAAQCNRLLRIAIWTVRGVWVHRLSLQAAALTYYTIFSIVPVLIVALWALKVFHLLPYLIPAAPKLGAALPGSPAPPSEPLLRSALRTILTAVQHANRVQLGLAGLLGLAYGVIKLFRQVARAIDAIASSRHRGPVYWRLLGYFALLFLPLVMLLIAASVTALSRVAEGTALAQGFERLADAVPLLRSAVGGALLLAAFSLSIATFYLSAARARLGFGSAMTGGLVTGIALIVVTWVFTRFQIGVTRASVLASGVAALPVFMLWVFVSWYVVLIGAEIAVGHDLDRTLSHGTQAWELHPLAEQAAGAALMVEVARRPAPPTTVELARQLRLLPATIRTLVARLTAAGLLRRADSGGHQLACDPASTTLGDVLDAVAGRPQLEASQWALAAVLKQGPSAHAGPSLRELAGRATD